MEHIKDLVIILIFVVPVLLLIIFCNDWRKCPKGGSHKWVFEEDLKIGHGWFGDMLVSINGHNIYSDNQRYVCTKCNLVEKVKN